jgi:hypothetical protein
MAHMWQLALQQDVVRTPSLHDLQSRCPLSAVHRAEAMRRPQPPSVGSCTALEAPRRMPRRVARAACCNARADEPTRRRAGESLVRCMVHVAPVLHIVCMLHEDYASAFRRRVQVSKVCLRDEICEAHPCIELQPTDRRQHATVPCPALPCPALPCPALPSPPIPSSILFATDNRQVCDRQAHPCVGLPQRDGIRTGGAGCIRQMRQAALS